MREEAKYRDISVFNNKSEKELHKKCLYFQARLADVPRNTILLLGTWCSQHVFFSNAFLCNCPFELNYVQLLFTSLLEDIDAAFVSRDVTSTVSTAHAGISQVKHYFINQ